MDRSHLAVCLVALVVVFSTANGQNNTTTAPSSNANTAIPSTTPVPLTTNGTPTTTTSPSTTESPTTINGTLNATTSPATTESPTTINGTLNATTSPATTGSPVPPVVTTPAPTTTSPATQIWNKVVGEMLGDQNSFIVMVVAAALCLILLIALIITCCRYRRLMKKTKFPKDLIINNDSAWINSNDDLLMWERNLRATEVNPATAAAPTARPANDKRV